MTIVNTATGEITEDFVSSFWSALTAPLWGLMGEDDDFIFEGLDDQLVAYLRAHIVRDPSIRATLARAADYRRRRAAQPMPARRRDRLVYFIAASARGLIKIGSAVDPAARLRTLSTGSPDRLHLLATIPGGEKRERELHARFAADRVRGEWFRPSANLLAVMGGGE